MTGTTRHGKARNDLEKRINDFSYEIKDAAARFEGAAGKRGKEIDNFFNKDSGIPGMLAIVFAGLLTFLLAIVFFVNRNIFVTAWAMLFFAVLAIAGFASSRQKKRNEKLYRSARDRLLGGVCAGFAEFLGIDVVIVRLLWILGALLWGAGLVLYLIMWIVMPRNPAHRWQ